MSFSLTYQMKLFLKVAIAIVLGLASAEAGDKSEFSKYHACMRLTTALLNSLAIVSIPKDGKIF